PRAAGGAAARTLRADGRRRLPEARLRVPSEHRASRLLAARARPRRRPHVGRTLADHRLGGVRVAPRARWRLRPGEPAGRAVALERRRVLSPLPWSTCPR